MGKAPLRSNLRPTAAILTAAALAALSTLLAPPPARGTNILTTWDGTVGDWLDPNKWSAGIPLNTPTNTFRPIINAGTVTLGTTATTSGFTLGSAGHFNLGSNSTYAVLASTGSSIAGAVTLGVGANLRILD
jgi:hypothetical protein